MRQTVMFTTLMTREMKKDGSQKTLEEIIVLNSHIDITAAMTRLRVTSS